jgi:hypothetical protein
MMPKKKPEIAHVGPISDEIRRAAEDQQFRQLHPQLMYAMEFGYICCENGLNIQAARQKFAKLYEKE